MGLIFTNLIYSILFFILTIKELVTDKYDHDIDQFMYFGSRILHGELIWTVEFDDKSPIVQYIFSLPAAFKSTSIFVLITLIVSLISAYLGYLMLKNIIQNSGLELSKNDENTILYFGIILYLTLLVCIYGSLHHINAISSSLCLIAIALTYANRKHNNRIINNISAITSAISISIRPYYLLNILVLPMWLAIRERYNRKENSIIKKHSRYIRVQLNWVILIIFYITIFNLLPYLLTGNLADILYGIKLNSIDYVNHNIFERQYINIGRNPILYPILFGIVILPLIRIFFRKNINQYYQKTVNGKINLYKLDVDIIFFGILNPILLEIMFYRKHFFGHYFTLFCPYILITAVILLAITARLNKLTYNLNILKQTIKSFSILLLIVCLITNQSFPNIISELVDNKISSKSYKVNLIKEFFEKERIKNKNFGFLAPENNYIHWKLDESRHGFPQKAVFRNIAKGKMDDLIKLHRNLNYKFLLPTKSQLCQTLNRNAPQYIITERNDYSFNCLRENSSEYKLLSATKELNENNIFIFKRFKN